MAATGHSFISYSSVDGRDFALRLVDALKNGRPAYPAWIDERDLRPGEDWDEQIVDAIRSCRALLFVMTADSVTPNSVCKAEWVRALSYKKPVIPLQASGDADLPFRLSSRQWIDFSRSFDAGLEALRQHLTWMDTPEGVLRELRHRLADAQRELERVPPDRRPLVVRDVQELTRRISAQRRTVQRPEEARRHAGQRIATALAREREGKRTRAAARTRVVNPAPMVAPAWFCGRSRETRLLGDLLRQDGIRMVTVSGRAGMGKTALVCRLLRGLESGRPPDGLEPLPVDGIVYLNPAGQHSVGFEALYRGLCRLLPEDIGKEMERRQREPQRTVRGLLLGMLEAFPGGRTIVLLDNFEDWLDGETSAITDTALDETLRTILSAPHHGVQVILTTRITPGALSEVEPGRQRHLSIDQGLPSPDAENVLRAMDVDGALGLRDADADMLAKARERTCGYPRALEALFAILSADRDTPLSDLLADAPPSLPHLVVHALVGEAFSRLDPLAQQVMQALAVYDSPVPAVALDYVLEPFQATIDSTPVLTRLVDMRLARRAGGRYELHQADRDYALSQVAAGMAGDRSAVEPSFTLGVLRSRAAEYFVKTRKPEDEWQTVDDLTPQLAEFELRCKNGDYDAAATVLLSVHDALEMWGHDRTLFGLLSRLAGKLSDPLLDSRHRSAIGYHFETLGQYSRAIDLHEQALGLARIAADPRQAADALVNLGCSLRSSSEIERARQVLEEAVGVYHRNGNASEEGSTLRYLSHCCKDLGDMMHAVQLLEQALGHHRSAGRPDAECADLSDLAWLHIALGDLSHATELAEQSITIAQSLGFRRIEASSLGHLARCAVQLGEEEHAASLCRKAIQIADDIGDATFQANPEISTRT